ncbi:MAG TPA: hypothetical protein VK190_03645 [Pseudoneobacillus sp.]|nr:hypothetical protein [Pseudoneobacillus sp.]
MTQIEWYTILGAYGELSDFNTDMHNKTWANFGVIVKKDNISYVVTYKDDGIRCQRAMAMINGHVYFFSISSFPIMDIYATEHHIYKDIDNGYGLIPWLDDVHKSFKDYFENIFLQSSKDKELLATAKQVKQPILFIKDRPREKIKPNVLELSTTESTIAYGDDIILRIMVKKWKEEGFML